MRGEKNRLSGIALLEHDLIDKLGIDRVKTGNRFIKNEQFGIVQHSSNEL